MDRKAFIREKTALLKAPLVPELKVHQAVEYTPLWEATERVLNKDQLPPPFWAFAWPGSQALARYVLDHPEVVRHRSVLDFGSGNGLAAIAAARAGARSAIAADIDPFAAAAAEVNAEANGVEVQTSTLDLVGRKGRWDVILAGDVCYERGLTEAVVAWLTERASQGIRVFVGDPKRMWAPTDGVIERARYDVPVPPEVEDVSSRETPVFELVPEADASTEA